MSVEWYFTVMEHLVVGGRNIQHVRDGEIRVLFDPGFPGFNDLHTDSLGRIYVGSLKLIHLKKAQKIRVESCGV